MSIFTAKAQAYINYINDLKYLNKMEPWKRELYSYQARVRRPVTLPSTDKEACLKAFNFLPKANYWALSYNLDTLMDYSEELT